MILEMIEYLSEVPPVNTEPLPEFIELGAEPRTYKCFCGDELVINFPEDCRWDEYEDGALADAEWVFSGREYVCPLHAEE